MDGKTGCAPTGPFIQGTCCAKGDNLVAVGTAKGYETVGLAVGGKLVAACGGLGLDVSDLSNPAAPVVISHENMRCQNAAFGPKLADGNQVLYTAGHGDGNIAMSSINIYYVTTAKKVTSVQLYKE